MAQEQKTIKKTGKAWVFGNINSFDETSIRYSYYRGANKSSHTLVFLNGRSEWIEKYNDIYKLLHLRKSCDILTWDHRGQGNSSGQRAHVDSYDEFIEDGKTIINQTIGEEASYTILAHSMGGLISIYGSLKGYFRPEQMILSAPLLMLPNEPLKRSLYIPASKLACRLTLGRSSPGIGGHLENFSENTLTRSFKGYTKVAETPYPSTSPTFGWVSATSKALDFVHNEDNLSKLPCPTLVIGGSQEAVVDYHGFSSWVQKADKVSGKAIKFCNIPGARHEILNEIDRTVAEVHHQIILWNKQNGFKCKAFRDS